MCVCVCVLYRRFWHFINSATKRDCHNYIWMKFESENVFGSCWKYRSTIPLLFYGDNRSIFIYNHDVDFSFDLSFFSPLKCDMLTITKILIVKGRRLEFPIARCLARKPGFRGRSLQIFIAASLNIYSSWQLSSSVCARCASLGRSISAWMFQVCAA